MEIDFKKEMKYNAIINILNEREEFILDAQGIILSSNLEAVCVTGYEEWEVTGKHFSLFYSKEDYLKEQFRFDLRELEQKKKIQVERLMCKRKAVPFWARFTLETLSGKGGQACYKMSIKDYTANAFANFQLGRVKKDYEELIDNFHTGIIRFKLADGVPTFISDYCAKILQNKPVRISEIFKNAEQYKKFKRELLKVGKVQAFEFEIDIPNETRWGILTCSMHQDDIVECVLQDVTERRIQIEQLGRLNNELQMLIYRSSHDLRSPLTSILGLSNLIVNESSLNKIHEYNQHIQRRVQSLDNTLRGLVSIAYNNSSNLDYSEFDIAKEAKFIINELKNDSVKTQLTIEKANIVIVDAVRLRTVLRCLWSNAMLSHGPDALLPMSSMHFIVNRDTLVITIEDNGQGIESDMQNKIFNMFFRGSTNSAGSGLGLYIVKSILDKVNGRIEVQSVVNYGSKFIVFYPIKGSRE